ncbi:MAG: hypothetical protein C0451_00365 [Comamonadaceae bacterium]|nr:hypothetical protein [Comamonadaceae bacterium]
MKPINRRTAQHGLLVSLLGLAWPGLARAHGDSHDKPRTDLPPEQKPWGIAGDPRKVSRTITIRMSDDMKLSPSHLEVRQGETLRLRAVNAGQVMHEIVIGTEEELQAHAELMKRFPGMAHDEPYMAHVPPGKRGDIVWNFNRAGEFGFACLIAGHFEAGMRGTLRVRPTQG